MSRVLDIKYSVSKIPMSHIKDIHSRIYLEAISNFDNLLLRREARFKGIKWFCAALSSPLITLEKLSLLGVRLIFLISPFSAFFFSSLIRVIFLSRRIFFLELLSIGITRGV